VSNHRAFEVVVVPTLAKGLFKMSTLYGVKARVTLTIEIILTKHSAHKQARHCVWLLPCLEEMQQLHNTEGQPNVQT